MKIVVLDGYTLNPGDLSWDGLKKFGNADIYDRTPSEFIIERAKDAEVLMTNKTLLDEKTLQSLPKLKYIGVLATGYNVVDIDAARRLGIAVTNIPTYGTLSVAQMTFALILEFYEHVDAHSIAVHNGDWSSQSDFCFWRYPLIELSGKTMGIIGFGRIGQQVADVAAAFGMNVVAFDSRRSDQSGRSNFKWAELPALLKEADIVSLHCPLFPDTKGIINSRNLSLMKKTAILINTSRGPLVVDDDLADALNNGVIAGAGLDVLSVEPPDSSNPLLKAKNCFITPHIAWATKEARLRLMDIAVENVKAFLDGKPANAVNA